MAHGNNNNRNKTALFLICSALLVLVFCKYHYFSYNNSNNGQEQPSSSALFSNNGSYKGTPWRTDRTIHVQTVAETKFARCDVHTVASEDGSSQINDWVFMEEMDAVNIIVMTAHDQLFPVFRQGKYAIPGETLSPVGGFVDAGEAPFESARREVMEELGLGSRVTLKAMQKEEGENTNEKAAFAAIRKRERTVDDFHLAEGDTSEAEVDWVFLGRYRTAANRGGGFIYTYLLKNAVPIVAGGGTTTYQMTGDDESQEIVLLSLEQIKNHMTQGHFQEVKWAATIALALLHLQNGHSSNA
jgi:8-oxo-dGTP pyrophosphatase MutT (NUDIX family)